MSEDGRGETLGGGALGRLWKRLMSRSPGPGLAPIHIGDPAYDRWEVVYDFEDAETARAFLQTVSEAGIEGVLTSDWALDQFGRGDIALRVRPEQWSEAETLLSGYDLD